MVARAAVARSGSSSWMIARESQCSKRRREGWTDSVDIISTGRQSSFQEDETTFRHRNLATASSIYHRKHHDSPRSFLWRILEDGTLLSIRSVDVCNKDANSEAPKILHFRFTTPIQPGCVTLADAEEHDSLSVFVLDQSYQLFTFTLRPDLFRKRTAVDASLPDIGKSFAPTGLGFKHPHRLVAVSTKTLLLTVNDGGIIRLDKNRTDQGLSDPSQTLVFPPGEAFALINS